MFFEDHAGKHRLEGKLKPDKSDVECAHKLRKYIARKDQYVSRDKKLWAVQFAILRRNLAAFGREIPDVLAWYISHKKTPPDLPKLANGRDFKKCYNWIHTKWKAATAESEVVELTDREEAIVRRTKGMGWPKGAVRHLPKTVHLTFTRYSALRDTVARVKPERHPKLRNVIGHLQRRLPSAAAFTEEWVTRLHKRLANWAEWDGKLYRNAFPAEHDSAEMKLLIRTIFSEYTSNPEKSTTQVMEAIWGSKS